ncbi:hypothetical protein GQ600_16964 [Phytophthora cactorum]|nr:hypothetical protein GQ600_16964 [Phytophthora cactorum]
MERREHGEDAQPAATTGETGNQDATMTAASRGVKRDSGSTAGQQQATAPTEENWSALSNLRVAVEETAAQTPGRPGSTSSDSNRHKVRRTNSYANPSTPQDDGSFSKSSLSFILDDQAASAAAAAKQGADGKRRARRPPSRICKHEGCEQYVVDQGLCVRHGAYERTDNLCNNHYQERQHGATVAAEGEATEDVAGSTSWHPDDEEKPPAPPADQ